jgi:hypothetical protein
LAEIEQKRFSDNLTIDKILDLFESFREIGFDDTIKRLSGRWRHQFNTRFFRLFSISTKETAKNIVGTIE